MKNENAAKWNVKNTSIKIPDDRYDRSYNSLLFNFLRKSKGVLHTNIYSSFSPKLLQETFLFKKLLTSYAQMCK
jgi:hypothetical protein